jgi:hypothetical protein
MLSQVTADELRPFLAVEITFETHVMRVWGGYGTILIDSEEFLGVGTLGSIGTIKETTQTQATGLTITLSGIPSDLIAVAIKEEYQGRKCSVYLGCLTEEHTVISEPYKIFIGKIDLMSIADDSNTASISLSVENRLIDLERPRIRRYTPEDQLDLLENIYGNVGSERFDKGFDFVSTIANKEIIWGS